ncbi:related to vacuolar Ca2+/H+ antiporter [Rhynchosporium agropyri]|uniref:Vacuolar calcium ion transporter n=1 Tax=Rhynchosporium agropyri TaxID=914238 RepID=A0A1E1LLC1_9HELO|nr:related to vacuolar Ca2+/H+ antiporter [Rhynchosporium agropyri]
MAGIFSRGHKPSTSTNSNGNGPHRTSSRRQSESQRSAPWDYPTVSNTTSGSREKPHGILPTHTNNLNRSTSNPNGGKKSKVFNGIQPEGESGRKGFHPFKFLKICWKSASYASKLVNLLWPVVPAAIALRYAKPDLHLEIFILNYIAMVPCANLVGFAGQELARKLPKVFGVLLETTLGSVVEIVLFMVLLNKNQFQVIRAAILGSILATLLLCLGMCFFIGGMKREEQKFHEAVSEVGSGLLLTAGLGLSVPVVFATALSNHELVNKEDLDHKVVMISRIASIILMVAFAIYVWFQMHTHHGLYDDLFENEEMMDEDRHKDLRKAKLTFTECIFALTISIALVTIIAIGLVEQIHHIVEEYGVSDAFMGLILVPIVEKAAEHLTAMDEAWDNQMNFALSHVLGATIQTALFNAPLVIIVAWGLHKPMDLNFELFDMVMLILAILVVGNFLRDGKSNYLEGALCVLVYAVIAVAAWFYPNPLEGQHGTAEGATEAVAEGAAEVVHRAIVAGLGMS